MVHASISTAAGAWLHAASCGLKAATMSSATIPMNEGAGLNSPKYRGWPCGPSRRSGARPPGRSPRLRPSPSPRRRRRAGGGCVAVRADSDRQTSDPRRVVHDEAGDVLEDPALLLGAGLQDAHRLITPRCGPSSALRPPPSAGDDRAARIRPPGPETLRSTPQHPPRPSIGLPIRDVPSMRSRGPKARTYPRRQIVRLLAYRTPGAHMENSRVSAILSWVDRRAERSRIGDLAPRGAAYRSHGAWRRHPATRLHRVHSSGRSGRVAADG